MWGDASAALGIINRKGLGKTRHIDTGLLWIQQIAAEQRLKYSKVLGKENPVDLYTKFLDAATSESHISKLEYRFTKGRSEEAPKLHMISQSLDEYLHGSHHELCNWVQALLKRITPCHGRKLQSIERGQINCLRKGSLKVSEIDRHGRYNEDSCRCTRGKLPDNSITTNTMTTTQPVNGNHCEAPTGRALVRLRGNESKCESRLGPHGARSNLVSQCRDGSTLSRTMTQSWELLGPNHCQRSRAIHWQNSSRNKTTRHTEVHQ